MEFAGFGEKDIHLVVVNTTSVSEEGAGDITKHFQPVPRFDAEVPEFEEA